MTNEYLSYAVPAQAAPSPCSDPRDARAAFFWELELAELRSLVPQAFPLEAVGLTPAPLRG
ncbi:MAG: hypothetical protein VKP62_09480 [Candidatus Sericytochromatia bacterium]|nr:hypothetical protein [Candidatus Sericytochromatia bacterium]